jgi:hypothetical protein
MQEKIFFYTNISAAQFSTGSDLIELQDPNDLRGQFVQQHA